jgi:hypothetical protein
MPEKYFWRSGREKCFLLDIPSHRTFFSQLAKSGLTRFDPFECNGDVSSLPERG